MSYITDFPSGGSWFDTTDGWYLYGSNEFLFKETLKGDGFDHVDNGPYALNQVGVDWGNVDLGRTFVCDGDLLYHFDLCYMGMDGSEGDSFELYGSLYTEDNPFPPSLNTGSYIRDMDVQYKTYSIQDLGETLPEEDQLNVWKNEHYADYYNVYFWKCESVAGSIVSSTDHIGYHIAMRSGVDEKTDVFAIRDFGAVCVRKTVPYNIFALSDPSDSIVFGFQTGPGNTPRASKATVVIDFYDDKGSDFLRCHHFGVKPSTSYACYSRSDNVFSISSDHNTDSLENKLIIRAFEHGGMDILAAFVGSAQLMTESISNVASAGLPQESVHFSSNTLWVKFALTTSDTETTIVFEDSSSVDLYSINDIDAEYGTIKTELDAVISVNFEWDYDPDAGDCMWDPAVDESINAIDSAGSVFGHADTAGTAAAVLADVAEVAQFAKAASALPVLGNAAAALSCVADLFGAGGPSAEELTQDALSTLKDGTDEMIKCNQQMAADKMNALKDAVDTALEELQDKVDSDLKELSIELVYKIHIENVEQELAGLQDTVDVLHRQWGYIAAMTDHDEIVQELKNILMNTMGRLGTVIKTKSADSDFDYFWRLYSKEMTLYIQEILALRFDIWMMWLFYNGVDSDKSIKDIEPDFRREFRDLTGELIGEYMDLLPMAILTIMKKESGSSELQPMTVTDRFREIELRFKPILICGWMDLAQVFTETEETDFLGDFGDLYDDNLDECASKVRAHIINEVVRVDNARHHDEEIIFGNELGEYSEVVHYQYDFFEESPNGYGCSYDWPESNNCRMSMDTDTNSNWGTRFTDINEGFLKLHIAPLLLIGEEDYVAPAILDISNSDTFRLDLEPAVCGRGDIPHTTLSISCSDGYRMGGIRFGTVSVTNFASYLYEDISVVDKSQSYVSYPIYIDEVSVNTKDIILNVQSSQPSRNYRTYETIAVKLLCRPIPQSEQDLYDTFTDYEIVTKMPDHNDEIMQQEVSWDEWTMCPIGTFIASIYNYWEQETGTVHLGYSGGSKTTGWSTIYYSFNTYDKERPISWISRMGINCYDGDQEHTYHSLLNDADISVPLFDIYSNSFKSDHFWALMVLLMVLVSVQLLFCLYQRKKGTKKIVHFDQETSDDENVVKI